MPFKANRDCRHHIPKLRHRVTNWAAYAAGLRARGSLTVWFTAEATESGRLSRAPAVAVSRATPAWRSPRL
jgi:hypothetical protein